MNEKRTSDLESVLGSTHVRDFDAFCKANKESMLSEDKAFTVYMKELFKEKGMSQQLVFLKGDIPERYGYKLLSGEKKTRQRDIILRICYAAVFFFRRNPKGIKKI